MKKQLLRSVLIVLTFILASCSSSTTEDLNTNGFAVDGLFYPTNTVYVDALDFEQNPNGTTEDAVTIILASDSYLNSPVTIDPLDYVMLKLDMTNLAQQPNVSLFNYYVGIDAYSNAGVPMDAITLLWQYSSNLNLTAIEKNVTINYVTPSQIDITYSFRRMDGKLITGQYVGPYINLR